MEASSSAKFIGSFPVSSGPLLCVMGLDSGGVWLARSLPSVKGPGKIQSVTSRSSPAILSSKQVLVRMTFYVITMEINILSVATSEARSHTCRPPDRGASRSLCPRSRLTPFLRQLLDPVCAERQPAPPVPTSDTHSSHSLLLPHPSLSLVL